MKRHSIPALLGSVLLQSHGYLCFNCFKLVWAWWRIYCEWCITEDSGLEAFNVCGFSSLPSFSQQMSLIWYYPSFYMFRMGSLTSLLYPQLHFPEIIEHLLKWLQKKKNAYHEPDHLDLTFEIKKQFTWRHHRCLATLSAVDTVMIRHHISTVLLPKHKGKWL